MVIYKLMNGLKNCPGLEDDEVRYKHIVENMIYVCELQPKNMFLYMCAVAPFDTYKLNIYTGSFLEDGFNFHMKDIWGIDKFDIVIGNPPFNQMIDMDFVKKSYRISDVILFVHPSTWLLDEKGKQKKFNETKDLIKNSLESIELFNGNKLFGIALFVPCVITYINKSKKNDSIKCVDRINDTELLYNNIFEINKFSNLSIYPSLKEKIIKISKNNNLLMNKNVNSGNYFINMAQIRGNVNLKSDKYMIQEDFYTIIPKDTLVKNTKEKHMFFSFTSKLEAENFLTFLKTDFCRFCLSILKNNSQLDRGELALIPWIDFSNVCSDDILIEKFKLNNDEVSFIRKNIPKYY